MPDSSNIAVRLATPNDVPAIVEIYNHEIENSTATFDTEPVTTAERQQWLSAHETSRHPATVAESAGVVVGWASLSSWSSRCAYARAAEVSVYVHSRYRRCGVGRALLSDLIARGRAAGLGVLLARIGTGEGPGSRQLHESLGFHYIGTMRRVGEKFDRILDVDLLELHLDVD